LSYETNFVTRDYGFCRDAVKNFEFNAKGIGEKFLTSRRRNPWFCSRR